MKTKNILKSLYSKFYILYSHREGFTFIEIIIVISILASVLTLSTINLYSIYIRRNLDLDTEEIVNLLRDAQNRAINSQDGNGDNQGDKWGVHFENVVNSSHILKLFSGDSYAGGTIAETRFLKSGIQFIEPTSGNSKDIIFSKINGLPDASTTVTISLANNPSAKQNININLNGRINY